MENEGFIHNGRRVFSLRYRLECQPPTIRELVVPLGPDGNALGKMAPADNAKRMVNVRPGDALLFDGCEHRVLAVEVYRSAALY